MVANNFKDNEKNPKKEKAEKSKYCSPRFRLGLCGVAGALLIAVAAVILIYFPVLVKHIIEKKIQIREDSDIYSIWQKPELPNFMQFYLFNITNYNDFLLTNAKPVLQEVGPYVYRQEWVKQNITWHSNGTVSYMQKKTFYFVPELSQGEETDRIFIINIPMLTAAHMFKSTGNVLKMVLTTVFTMTEATLIVNPTIRELIWDGYDDPIMKMFKEVMPNAPYPYSTFAVLYGRNDSTDGVYTVYTGVDDPSMFNKVDRWNGKQRVDQWFPSYCGDINGTTGEIFKPDVDSNAPLYFFNADLCRSIYLEYSGTVEHYGINGYRFEASPRLFQNATENPDNQCFCNGDCLPSGVFNLSSCKFDAPVVGSLPHFLYGDSRYVNQAIGLNPNKELHRMYVDLEPHTGAPLEVGLRLQVNVLLERIPGISNLESVSNTVFPILWFAQIATINDDMKSLLKLAAVDSHIYGKVLYCSLFILGGLLTVCAAIYYIFLTRRSKSTPFTVS